MRIKFSFVEKEEIGIGVSKIVYETNLRMEDYPAFSLLKERYEEAILRELGASIEEAKKDSVYTMDFIVRKKMQLGVLSPGEHYTLVVTTSTAIKKIERSFQIQGE